MLIADSHPQYAGLLLKVGYTARDVKARMAEHYPTLTPGKPTYSILLEESAMRPDGTAFSDHDVHRVLRAQWFQKSQWRMVRLWRQTT